MNRNRKALFLLLAGAASLLALAAAALLLAPRLANTAAVRDFALSRLERATGVRLSYATAEVTLYPRLHVALRDVSLALPGTMQGTIPAVSADAALLPLLRGEIRLGNVLLESPDFRARLPEKPEKPLSLEELEKEISSVLERIREMAPGMAAAVRNGRLDLSDRNGPVVLLRDLEAQVALPPGRVTARIRCTSPYWDGLSLETSLRPEGLRSETRLETAGLRLREIAERLSPGDTPWLGETVLSVRGRIDAEGLRTATAEIAGSIPVLTIRRGSRRSILRVRTVKATLDLKDNTVHAALHDLAMDEPEMRLSGEVTVDRAPSRIAVQLNGDGLKVAPARNALLAVAGDVPAVRSVLDVVRGGVIPRFSLRSEARFPRDLGDADAIGFRASLTGGSIRIPGPDLALEEVGGEVTLARGILEGSGIVARLGNARATGGSLRMGIAGSDPPFHAEFQANADLAELPPLLRRLVPDDDFRGELDRIRDVRGTASGRVALGERLSSVGVRFTASNVRFSAIYDRIPFPVAFDGGQVAYDGSSVAVEDLRGTVGKSSFSGVTGKVSLPDPTTLSVRSGKGRLALGELFPWISPMGPVRELAPEVRRLEGVAGVEALTLAGVLRGEGTWTFDASGSVEDIALDAHPLPGTLSVPAGRFRVRPESVSFSGVTLSLLDATARGAIELDGYRTGTERIAAAFDGEVGPELAQWAYDRLEVPKPLAVRAPYTVTGSEIAWERGGTVRATAAIGFEGGIALSFNAQTAPGRTAVDPLEIRGPGSDARIAFRLDRDTAHLKFAGTLTRETIERMVPVPSLPGHRVRGDLEAVLDRAKPARSTARGTLEASGVTIPWEPLSPLGIRYASLEADGRSVRLLSSRLVWDNVPFTASGTAVFGGEEMTMDMDISTGDIDAGRLLPTLKLSGAPGAGPGGAAPPAGGSGAERGDAEFAVRGTLRLAADSVSFRRFTWRPVRAIAEIGGKTVRLSISDANLCGISTVGTAVLGGKEPSIALTMSSTGEEIQGTILCLTEKRASISGKYNLSSRLSGEGTGDALLRTLDGPVAVDLTDGWIRQMTVLSRIFSFLNLTETLRGRFPDLRKEGFPFRKLTIRGEAKGGTFTVKEAVLDAPSMQILATGEVDLLSRETDLKVLVAPLRNVDAIVEKIPVLGYILGGTLLSFPVTVKGDLQDPRVTPMDPGAVGSGLLGLAERTLKLPAKIISPLLPDAAK